MKWLITGGCGFIGRNLVKNLVDEGGHYIRIVDNLSAGTRENLTDVCAFIEYDPDKFRYTHTKGMHKYCITKHLFDSDLVISLPKAKTHQKAGITAALKNIVGLNGDKDYLPHHRIGGTEVGGDAYPGKSYFRYSVWRRNI